MRYWLWLCLLLWACGNAPVDPLAPDRQDRAVQARLSDAGLLYYSAQGEIVYWLFHRDGKYQFRWTRPGGRWLVWEVGYWWIANRLLWLDPTRGEFYDLEKRTQHSSTLYRRSVNLKFLARRLQDTDLQVVLGPATYRVVPLSVAQDSIRAFEE